MNKEEVVILIVVGVLKELPDILSFCNTMFSLLLFIVGCVHIFQEQTRRKEEDSRIRKKHRRT